MCILYKKQAFCIQNCLKTHSSQIVFCDSAVNGPIL